MTRGYVTAQAKLLNLPWNPTRQEKEEEEEDESVEIENGGV